MPTFSIAATWQDRASPDAAARAVEALESFFPKGNVEELDVGLGEEMASLHLKLTFSPYPHALIQKASKEINGSGGRFLELWRLPKEDRESFRSKNLATARRRPDFESAAELIREHVAKLAAAPRKAPPPPTAAPAAPKEAPTDSLEGALRTEVEAPPAAVPRPAEGAPEEESFRMEVETPEDSALGALDDSGGEEEVFRVELAAAGASGELTAGGASSLEDALAVEVEVAVPDAAEPPPPAPPGLAPATTRRSPRYAVSLEVDFKSELDFVREHAANISNGGLFVQTEQRPAPGTPVEVKVRLPNGEVLHSQARVAHLVDSPQGGGVGVAFTNEDPAFQETLDRYLASLIGGS